MTSPESFNESLDAARGAINRALSAGAQDRDRYVATARDTALAVLTDPASTHEQKTIARQCIRQARSITGELQRSLPKASPEQSLVEDHQLPAL
jgi:hypothetical protein